MPASTKPGDPGVNHDPAPGGSAEPFPGESPVRRYGRKGGEDYDQAIIVRAVPTNRIPSKPPYIAGRNCEKTTMDNTNPEQDQAAS